MCLIFMTKDKSEGSYFEEQISPAVPLEGGDGDVQRVSVRQTVALMNRATRKIQQITSFQHHVHDGLPDLILTEISLRRNATETAFTPLIKIDLLNTL